MSKIFKNSIIFGFLLVVTMSLIQFALPFYWGSETTYSRFAIAKKKIANADILFFGSSRTLYHVHTRIFSNKTNTKAYNLGIQQGRILELNNQIREFVKRYPAKNDKTKKIVYELCAVEKLQPKVMHTNRTRHCWNLNTLFKSTKYNLISKNYSEIQRAGQTFLEYLFKVDFIKEYWLLKEHKKKIVDETYYGAITMPKCAGCIMNANTSMARSDKKIRNVQEKTKRIQNYYNSYKSLNPVEEEEVDFLLNEVIELQKFIEVYGYELVIINQTGPLKTQLSLYNKLEELGLNCIDMGDPSKYPEFYNPENLFDIAHLTRKGAIEFTTSLIEEFNALNL